jgi:hypothetical protein
MTTITYTPNKGLSINEVLKNAQTLAVKGKKTVIAEIDNVTVCITPKTNLNKALALYKQRVNEQR